MILSCIGKYFLIVKVSSSACWSDQPLLNGRCRFRKLLSAAGRYARSIAPHASRSIVSDQPRWPLSCPEYQICQQWPDWRMERHNESLCPDWKDWDRSMPGRILMAVSPRKAIRSHFLDRRNQYFMFHDRLLIRVGEYKSKYLQYTINRITWLLHKSHIFKR